MKPLLQILLKCPPSNGRSYWTREVCRTKCHIGIFTVQKHPAQLKFVLVDPKKVELTLFNKIERHFLAKLPDAEEASLQILQKSLTQLILCVLRWMLSYDLLKKAPSSKHKGIQPQIHK
ncbi:MAG: hypothetical protein CM15mP23_08200 [Cryomorphaceae bacterium]|nr:MAG: hypothetical protein CM15mP23_08200 [Cryomorphaceae bacterium]